MTVLSEDVLKEIVSVRKKYPEATGAVMPALYIVQREFGYLSFDAYEVVSNALNLPRTIVKGVGTFYAMYRHEPAGRNLIQLCTNVSCMILGAERLVDFLKNKYGLEPGGTTTDKRFSLMIMECIGACGTAPAMLVNDDLHENLSEKSIEDILEKYK
ncbi:MAG: NAD(P)H-dependent oxidoreductase subunit E [Nitrospiraceae bacterium]|nr:NAD(P)H-dependent oxidoreductase subunit E [Nitrospiraceae bacterium]